MHTLTILTAGVAMLMTGCQTARPSKTWETVKATPKVGPGVTDRSSAYADQLHKALQKAGVEHKVVTFTFKYATSMMVDAPAQDVAVIYKDAASPAHPWWLMAECLWSPRWLPTQSIGRQVDFYLARPSAIVAVAEFPAASPSHAKPHRHRAKPHHAAKKRVAPAEEPASSPEKKSVPNVEPLLGKEPGEQAVPGNDAPVGSAPLPTPKPDAKPENGGPDKPGEPKPAPAPKAEPPVRKGPQKTVPVHLDRFESAPRAGLPAKPLEAA